MLVATINRLTILIIGREDHTFLPAEHHILQTLQTWSPGGNDENSASLREDHHRVK